MLLKVDVIIAPRSIDVARIQVSKRELTFFKGVKASEGSLPELKPVVFKLNKVFLNFDDLNLRKILCYADNLITDCFLDRIPLEVLSVKEGIHIHGLHLKLVALQGNFFL